MPGSRGGFISQYCLWNHHDFVLWRSRQAIDRGGLILRSTARIRSLLSTKTDAAQPQEKDIAGVQGWFRVIRFPRYRPPLWHRVRRQRPDPCAETLPPPGPAENDTWRADSPYHLINGTTPTLIDSRVRPPVAMRELSTARQTRTLIHAG